MSHSPGSGPFRRSAVTALYAFRIAGIGGGVGGACGEAACDVRHAAVSVTPNKAATAAVRTIRFNNASLFVEPCSFVARSLQASAVARLEPSRYNLSKPALFET